MGTVIERGGSNLAWYRLDHGLGIAPPTGGNCREQWGIVRNYSQPGVRSATQDILDRFRAAGQCWIRVNFYVWESNAGSTLVDISSGVVPNGDLNNLMLYLQDIRDRGFKLNFAIHPIGATSPQEWNSFQQQSYDRLLSTILQLHPLIDNFGWPDYHIDLSNEMQAASNQSPAMRQFGWQIYRDFGNVHGVSKTGGVSIGMGAGPPGLSRYNIQFQDQNGPGQHGVSPIMDVHGYAPFGNSSTNWLKLLENEMISNGDTRDIRISETFASVHGAHVSQMLANISQLDRNVEHIIQWGLTQFGNCSDVDYADTVEFDYGGEGCIEGIDCGESVWS